MNSSYNFCDEYDHIDGNIEYILENILSENVVKNIETCEESRQLNELFNTVLLNKCECDGSHQDQCSMCSHGVNYKWNDEFRELILRGVSENMPNLLYECSHMCSCDIKTCRNRLVQCGPRKFLKIVHSEQYGSKGIITTRDIPKGAFICEYAGELLTSHEAKNESPEIGTRNAEGDVLITILNPNKKGNIGRYLNHSCEPNCQIISVRIDSPIPKICFFSNRFIKAGEEICFNYNEGIIQDKLEKASNHGTPCLCGSKYCLKYLPNSE